MWTIDCLFISTITRLTRRERINTRGRIFLEMLGGEVVPCMGHLIFMSSSDGKMSSKTLLHTPPSRGNYRSLQEAGHLEAGRFSRASEQACRGSCSLGWGHRLLLLHLLRWQGMFASPQGCSILWIIVHAAKAKPSLVLGRFMVAPAASLSHLLSSRCFCSSLSTNTFLPKSKEKRMLCVSPTTAPVQTLPGFAFQRPNPMLMLFSSQHPRGMAGLVHP